MLMRELVERTGLSSATLRFYEHEGLLDEQFINRSSNNYRNYKETAIERVMMIKQGQTAGFTLAEIKQLLRAWDAGQLTTVEQIVYLEQKRAELSQKIAELEAIQTHISDKLSSIASLAIDQRAAAE